MISKRLVDPLALGLLKGEYAAGDRMEVDAADGELLFTPRPGRVARLGLEEGAPDRDRHAHPRRAAAAGE